MPSGTHYVVEGSFFGMVHVRASDAAEPLAGFRTLQLALDHITYLNPDDVPEIMPPLKHPKAE